MPPHFDYTGIPPSRVAEYQALAKGLQDDLNDRRKAIRVTCGCGQKSKTYILFYSFWIKKQLSPKYARIEFYNNWLAFGITVASLIWGAEVINNNDDDDDAIDNDDDTKSSSSAIPLVLAILGFCSFFLGNCLMNYWYGFYHYPNFGRRLLLKADANNPTTGDEWKNRLKDQDAEFLEFRNKMEFLSQGHTTGFGTTSNMEEEEPTKPGDGGMKCIGCLIRFLNEGWIVLWMSLWLTLYFPCLYVSGLSKSPQFAVFLGHTATTFASVFWALQFIIADIVGGSFYSWWKVVAAFFLFATEEYYTCMLYRKGALEFIKGVILNVFYDIIDASNVFGKVPGVPNQMADGVQNANDVWNEFQDNLDLEEQDSANTNPNPAATYSAGQTATTTTTKGGKSSGSKTPRAKQTTPNASNNTSTMTGNSGSNATNRKSSVPSASKKRRETNENGRNKDADMRKKKDGKKRNATKSSTSVDGKNSITNRKSKKQKKKTSGQDEEQPTTNGENRKEASSTAMESMESKKVRKKKTKKEKNIEDP